MTCGSRPVLLADYAGKTELSHVAENLSGDIRAARYIAHVLGKHFFLPILTDVAGSDNNLRHCFDYRNVSTISYATNRWMKQRFAGFWATFV